METGYGAAGNGYKQNREQVTGFLIVETSVRRQVHCRMCDKQSNDGTDNHTGKHKGCHQVTRFHQKPHRKNGCEENVSEYHVGPVCLGGNERAVHADDESSYRADKSEHGLFPAMELSLFLNQSKYNGKGNEQKGNASGCAVDSCGGG